MTAIQGNVVEDRARQALHAQDASSLAAAQSRFMAAVSEGVAELMRRSGYSRERATTALLRELGRGDAPPQNDEIFDMMTAHGFGVDDAAQVLTVSRAVGRAMEERGLSPAEAIDELASKLSITKLLASGVEDPKESLPPRPCSPEVRVAPTPTTAPSTDRPSSQQRKLPGRKLNAKPVQKNGKQKASKGNNISSKNQSRKRPSPDESKQGDNVKFSSRARADSVSEVVEAKVAKKARISPEEPSEAGPIDIPANPIVLRTKRNAARGAGEDAQSTHSGA